MGLQYSLRRNYYSRTRSTSALCLQITQVAPTFTPSGKLTNLYGLDEVESLAPLTDMLVGDLAREDTPQMYTLCGRGNQSSLR